MHKIALIPAYCPEDRMIMLLKELSGNGFEILVIDDGSGSDFDRIFDDAAEFATVLRYQPNRGKGEAIRYGLQYIIERFPAPYTVVTADADGQHRTEDIVKVSDIAADHPDTLVLGKRRLDKSTPIKSRIGNSLTRVFYHLTTGRKIYETQTGLRAFSDILLPRFLKLPGHRYEYEIDMMLSAADIDIIETEIQTIYFDNNSASHFRPIKDTISLNKEFIRYKIPSLIAGCFDYALFVALTLMMSGWLIPNLIARVCSLILKSILNKAVFFSEKATLFRFLLTSIIILLAESGVLWGLTAIGMNLYLAKFIAAVLMIGVSILVRKILMYHKYRS